MKEIEERNLRFVLDHYKKGLFNTSAAISAFHRKTSSGVKTLRVRPFTMIASVVAAAVVSVAVIIGISVSGGGVETVLAHEKMTVTLPDSTVVTLAPEAMLSYKKGVKFTENRRVELSGKAFFSVTSDRLHPFEVVSDNSYVKVLGTKFQVDGDRDVTKVYVESGKVFFARTKEAEGLVLTKDMAARCDNETGEVVPLKLSQLNPVAWVTGVFEYDSAPIESVLSELSHFYAVDLVLASPISAQNKNLTGRFFADDMQSVISAIEEALDVKIETK